MQKSKTNFYSNQTDFSVKANISFSFPYHFHKKKFKPLKRIDHSVGILEIFHERFKEQQGLLERTTLNIQSSRVGKNNKHNTFLKPQIDHLSIVCVSLHTLAFAALAAGHSPRGGTRERAAELWQLKCDTPQAHKNVQSSTTLDYL